MQFACLLREFAMSVFTAAADQSLCAPLSVLGKDVTVPLVTGGEVTYAALDYAASAPALQRVWTMSPRTRRTTAASTAGPATSRSFPRTSSRTAARPSR